MFFEPYLFALDTLLADGKEDVEEVDVFFSAIFSFALANNPFDNEVESPILMSSSTVLAYKE